MTERVVTARAFEWKNMPLTLDEYRDMARKAPTKWAPDPFEPHPRGDWILAHFEEVVIQVAQLLERHDRGIVTTDHLLGGKDNGPRKRDTLNYWLYYQHHPGSEKWKLLGQHYWSVQAWRSWCTAGGHEFPKRKRHGLSGLVSEHVVPKKVMQNCILEDQANLRVWLKRNLCGVITVEEDGRLPQETHPNPNLPWLRYEKEGITLIHNQRWSEEQIEPLLRHGLVNRSSFPTSIAEES